jgi:hypothetical protein
VSVGEVGECCRYRQTFLGVLLEEVVDVESRIAGSGDEGDRVEDGGLACVAGTDQAGQPVGYMPVQRTDSSEPFDLQPHQSHWLPPVMTSDLAISVAPRRPGAGIGGG